MIRIHCTYCWRTHYTTLKNYLKYGCGKDPRRYFFASGDYRDYLRAYEAAGCRHVEVGQMRLL